MYQEFFAKSPLLALPIAALLIFIVSFGLIVVRELRRGGQRDLAAARLPLDDEAQHG